MEPRPPRTEPLEKGHERPYEMQLFVCTKGPECPKDGPADEIRTALKSKAKELGLKDRVRVNNAGCLGQCGHGPMMVVYPEGVWYSHLTVAEALEVFERHVVSDEGPVKELRFTLGPGGCKAARNPDGSSTCAGECRA